MPQTYCPKQPLSLGYCPQTWAIIPSTLGFSIIMDLCCSIDLSLSRRGSIYFTAVGVIIVAIFRLFLEVYQMISQRFVYFKDWVNWLEWIQFLCSIIFVFIFGNINGCLCVLRLQWEVGIVAVFLGWIGLVIFVSKLPRVGLYVIMLLEILKTTLRVLIFSLLLVTAFALCFYMAFFEAGITVMS